MSLIYIFAASPIEAEPVRTIAGPPDSQSIARCGVTDLVLFTGAMGPRNARTKADLALSGGKPAAILVIGLCGGLTASLPEGRIVAYTDCLSTEAAKPVLQCSQALADSLVTVLTSSGFLCDRVVGITSPRIATTRNERLDLASHGASAVDMESYSILESAAAAGVSAAVLRVVVDSIDRVLPNLNRALNETGGLDGRKALKVVLGSPLRTARLLAANKRAMQHLGKALEVVLKAPCFG